MVRYVDMQHGHVQYSTRSMDRAMQHEYGQGHVTWISTSSIDKDMQHRHKDMSTQHRYGHEDRQDKDMDMLHGWICSINMGMPHGNTLAT